MTAELRRGLFPAILGLALGLGLVAGLFGGGAYLKRALLAPAPATEPAPAALAATPESAGGAAGRTEPGRLAGLAPPGAASRPDSPAAEAGAPTFDIVRVEPNGDAVIAGRGAPNTVVDLLLDGRPVARARADPNGQFALVPPALPAGSSEIVLRATDATGREVRSKDSVAVAVSASRAARPLVALTSPDRPTVVLSQPDAPPQTAQAKPGDPAGGAAAPGKAAAPGNAAGLGRTAAPGNPAALGRTAAAGAPVSAGAGPGGDAPGAPGAPVRIVSVDAQEGGRLSVSGRAPPGATVRLYLNDTPIAPARVGADGTVAFTIGRGVKPGAYRVRVDQVDPVSGKVGGRAEVPFSVPEPAHAAAGDRPAARPEAPARVVSASVTAPGRTGAASAPPAPGTLTPAALEPPGSPSRPVPGGVFVAEVGTAKIIRGDSLWQISRRTYGAGDRYTVIYDANQQQIRNPDLIYPGQIFVLPGETGREAGRGGRRG